MFEAVLACAQKGRLIEINGIFSANQTQEIQEAYDAAILASYQSLALATALLTTSNLSSPSTITLLSPDLLQSIAEEHTHRSTTPSKKVLDRFKTEPTNIRRQPSTDLTIFTSGGQRPLIADSTPIQELNTKIPSSSFIRRLCGGLCCYRKDHPNQNNRAEAFSSPRQGASGP